MAIGRTKDYNDQEFKRILVNNGFVFIRQKGDHYIYKRGNDIAVTTKKPNKMMIRRYIKQFKLKF